MSDRLAAASLTVNLGKEGGLGRVGAVNAKVMAIVQRPLTSVSYTGLLAWLATKLAPLICLRRPGSQFDWTPECQQIFESVKASLCGAPVLAAPDCDRLFR